MYQTEHDELFAGIRSGKPINNGEHGKSPYWRQGAWPLTPARDHLGDAALNSTEVLSPSRYDWDAQPPSPRSPPGQTRLI
jgi:hypothetical protein